MRLSNKVVNGLVSVLAVIAIAFGLGCYGKGGDDEGGSSSGTTHNLRVKILDQGNEPVPDVYVVLHKANGSVESYKTTGSDGIANFGNIGRTRATISIAYVEEADEYGSSYSIKSWVNIPFLTGEDNTFFVYPDEEKIATIDVTTTGEGYDDVYLQPFDDDVAPGATISENVRPRHIQDDGKLSMSAAGITEPNLIKYGYLMDQTVTDGSTYTIALDKTPTEIEFSSTNGNITDLYVGIQRKGIDFKIGKYEGVEVSSGLIKVADQLPEDYGYCMTEAWDSTKGQAKKYLSLPDPISVSMPDFSIDAVDFADSTITWTKSGSQGIDMTKIEMDFYLYSEESYKDVEWIVMVNPTIYTDEWNLFNLQLPDVIDAWFGGCSIDDIEVKVFDTDTATGFEDFITRCLKNPNEDWASWFDEEMYAAWGYKELVVDGLGRFSIDKNNRIINDKPFHKNEKTHLFKK